MSDISAMRRCPAPPAAARSKSAAQIFLKVRSTARVMPGRCRTCSSSTKPPSSSAFWIAASNNSAGAAIAKPPASLAAA